MRKITQFVICKIQGGPKVSDLQPLQKQEVNSKCVLLGHPCTIPMRGAYTTMTVIGVKSVIIIH